MISNRLVEGKVHMKDIKEGKHSREMDCLIVGDKKFWSMTCTKDQLATHDDCIDCGKEFEKVYSNDRRCLDCKGIYETNKYLDRPFMEWDGKSAVYSETLDMYFFDSDEIDDYLSDNDEKAENLRLLICTPNYARSLDFDFFVDELPEDSEELPDSLEKAVIEFNKALEKVPPLSYSSGKNRTSYIK